MSKHSKFRHHICICLAKYNWKGFVLWTQIQIKSELILQGYILRRCFFHFLVTACRFKSTVSRFCATPLLYKHQFDSRLHWSIHFESDTNLNHSKDTTRGVSFSGLCQPPGGWGCIYHLELSRPLQIPDMAFTADSLHHSHHVRACQTFPWLLSRHQSSQRATLGRLEIPEMIWTVNKKIEES